MSPPAQWLLRVTVMALQGQFLSFQDMHKKRALRDCFCMSVQKVVFVNVGDCKLSNRISKGLVNFEELSLEFNIE